MRYGHTPDVIPLASPAVGVLVAEEADKVDVVARVLAGLAVNARRGPRGLIAVQVEEAVGNVLLALCHLPALQYRHVDGIRGACGAQGVRIEDGHALGGGGAGQSREDKGRDACLHLDCALGIWNLGDLAGQDGSRDKEAQLSAGI